ncbi:MAG TPA: carbohydrate ABC transporter substrate-binding protein [Candidatus Pelethocola excrementipullorum]|nr:carbohydrate ABC transporter substrate-binding protein [Candidatus Pelethocola excrementipullorum]
MMRKFRGIICLFLVFIMVFSGCSSKGTQNGATKDKGVDENSNGAEESLEDQGTNTGLKGRYAEKIIDFPEKVRKVFDLRWEADGRVKILFENEPGSIHMYESEDAGVSWVKKEGISKGLIPEQYAVKSACFGPQESIIVSAGEGIVNEFSEPQIVGEFQYFEWTETEGDIQVNELQLNLPEPGSGFPEAGYGLNNLTALENGYIYGTVGTVLGEEFNYGAYKLVCIDKNNGNIVWSMDLSSDEYTLDGDRIFLMEHERSSTSAMESENGQAATIRTINAETGEESGSYEMEQVGDNIDCVDFDTENEKIYYCTKSGIYGTDFNRTLTEQLVDGNINSISSIEYSLRNFYSINQSVFILFMRSNTSYENLKILRYEYDPDLVMLPDHELNVYSLKENRTVKKMISDFQIKNPDVYVKYEIGMEDGSVKTISDAISILNTEIMAGNGPDVLILNELPWKSYAEKGILEDMSDELGSYLEGEQVFQNIFSAYQQEGSQYVVPVGFRIPVLIGHMVEGIESSDQVVSSFESISDVQSLFLFGRKNTNLLRYMASVNWHTVQKEDGTISEDGLKKILENTKKINDIVGGTEEEYQEDNDIPKTYDAFSNDSWLNTQGVGLGDLSLDMNYLSTLLDYAELFNYDLAYQPTSKQVFSSLVAGVNGEADAKDLGKEFIRFIIGEEEQGIFFNKIDSRYLPVNRDAYHNMTKIPDAEEMKELEEKFHVLGVEYNWPEESWFSEFEELIGELKTPAMEDGIVIDAVIEYGLPYVRGEKELDEAVHDIMQKLELYYAE